MTLCYFETNHFSLRQIGETFCFRTLDTLSSDVSKVNTAVTCVNKPSCCPTAVHYLLVRNCFLPGISFNMFTNIKWLSYEELDKLTD